MLAAAVGRVGAELWVKHENHTPTGAFKIRGGLVYLDALRRAEPGIAGVISATTGNHGQSVAYAASRLGLAATIVVPHGNSPEKNRAMRGFGATLVEHGHDFQAAYEHAIARAAAERLHLLPSFHPLTWCAAWRAMASNCSAPSTGWTRSMFRSGSAAASAA